MRSPLLAVAACFALGIALEHSERPSLPGIPLWLGCAVCLLAGLLALRAELRVLPFLLALSGFVGAGATAARLFEFRFPPNHVSRLAAQGIDLTEPVHLEGRVVSTPFRTAYGHQFDLEVERLESGGRLHPVTGRVRLRLQHGENGEAEAAAEALRLQYGDSIGGPVRLRRPPVYQNPGGFDFRRWMESIEDLDWLGTIRSPLLIEKLPRSRAFQLGGLLESTRRRLRDGIDRMYPPWSGEARNGAVLKAVLLGDRSSLDSETIENFRKAGLYHLLVIAGLHVGLLAMLAALLLRLVPIREPWRWAAVLLFLLAYASLVEQRAATLRATVMITVYLLARLAYREHAALNAIGVAALVLLVGRPAWLFEAGFQLSFSAALLIVALVAPILELTTEPYRRALRRLGDVDLDASLPPRQARFRLDLRDLVKVLEAHVPFLKRHPSLSVALVTGPAQVMLWSANVVFFAAMLQLGLLLPMAETFHRVSYAGIGLNALAIPVMTLLLAVAVPAVVLSSLLPALGPWLARLLAPLLSAVFALTDLPNLPVWLSYRVPEPPNWVAWGFALAVVLAAWTLGRQARVFWSSLGVLSVYAVLISLHPFPPRLPRGLLEVTALDCGGGEAFFVVLPDRTTLLANACGARSRATREGAFQAGRWDPGEEIVSPYLWSRGVKKIDILLLTDGRGAHLTGAAAVVRNFRIGEFWQGASFLTPAAPALFEQLQRRGVSIRQVGAGDRVERGGASLQVLWPRTSAGDAIGWPASRLPSTDDPLVLRIAHEKASVLLAGNLNGVEEKELARSAVSLQSDVLDLAPRGAKSSFNAEFVALVSPRVVLWAGEANSFSGSPSSEAVDRLRAKGARVFRTAVDGAVTVEMKESALAVHTYRTSAGEGMGASPGTLTLSVP